MDGVLYDSMPRHCKAWRQAMLEEGLDLQAEEFFQYEGMTGEATINLLMQREKGLTLPPEECKRIYERKAELFKEQGEASPMPGAKKMLETLKREGILTILVTGSAQGSLLDRLDEDYPGFFPADRRVTALDVERGKPDPEPYLRGLQKAGVDASEAVVIENAPLGVRAGKGAGVFSIAWMTGPIPPESFLGEGADLLIPRNYFLDSED